MGACVVIVYVKNNGNKQSRNAVVRQARSSETHQRESHAGVRDSRPRLIKDASGDNAVERVSRRGGEASTKYFYT